MNDRRRQIIKMILNGRTSIKFKDMEALFGVGERTIRYDLEMIADLLSEHEIELVHVSGQGMWKLNTHPDAEALKALYDTMQFEERAGSAEERFLLIAHELAMAQEWLSLRIIAEELEVSKGTVLQHMPQIEKIGDRFNLKLERGRKGFRFSGMEKSRRLFLLSLMEKLEETWDTVDPLPNLNWADLSLKDLNTIERIVSGRRLEHLDPTATSRIFALALQRTRSGAPLADKPDVGDDAPAEAFTALWGELKEALDVQMAPQETAFAWLYLQATGGLTLSYEGKIKEDESFMTFIEAFSKRMGITHFGKKQLKEVHREWRALNVAQAHDITYMHPLRGKIEEQYPFILFHLEEALRETDVLQVGDQTDSLIPMAISLAAIYEIASFENERYHIWVVCPSGLAASRLLTVSLMKHFPQVEVKRTMAISELEDVEEWDKPDFIVTSVTLHDCPYPHITVKPVINEEEIKKIEQFISNTARNRDSTNENGLEHSIHAVIPKSRMVVSGAEGTDRLEQILDEGISLLEDDGLVTEGFYDDIHHTVFQKKYLYEIIPGLLFIHGNSDHVLKAGFSLVQLKDPYVMEGKLHSTAVLFMATPDKDAHIPQLQYLYQIFMNEGKVKDLLDWTTTGLTEG